VQCTPISLQCSQIARSYNSLTCLFMCLSRKLNLDDPIEWEVSKFYVLVLLSRVAGSKGWEDRQRYHTTVSRAVAPYDTSKKLFHVSMEAFAAYLWENNRDRWTLQLKYLYEHPNEDRIPDRDATNKDDPMFKGKYTTQNSGQNRFGGTKVNGIKRYNELYCEVFNAKYQDPKNPDDNNLKDEWVQWEEAFLKKIRLELGIDDGANAGGRRRKGKAKEAADEPVVAALGMDFGI